MTSFTINQLLREVSSLSLSEYNKRKIIASLEDCKDELTDIDQLHTWDQRYIDLVELGNQLRIILLKQAA